MPASFSRRVTPISMAPLLPMEPLRLSRTNAWISRPPARRGRSAPRWRCATAGTRSSGRGRRGSWRRWRWPPVRVEPADQPVPDLLSAHARSDDAGVRQAALDTLADGRLEGSLLQWAEGTLLQSALLVLIELPHSDQSSSSTRDRFPTGLSAPSYSSVTL